MRAISIKQFLLSPWLLLPIAQAVSVSMNDGISVLGKATTHVESFNAIPYADPPVGNLRLRPPQRFSNKRKIREIDGTGKAPACPQIPLPAEKEKLGSHAGNNKTKLIEIFGQEDCLTIDIARPSGAKPGDDLPVLFWIYGGGFVLGSTGAYNATLMVQYAAEIKQPFIWVGVNYRLGGFGFLPGQHVLDEKIGNLGLRDQRLGLEWVADNIKFFGGDPSKVTIWGESAGSVSVLNQMILYGGNSYYKNSPLFRGAIMNSGTVFPANPMNSSMAQSTFRQVTTAAGCENITDPIGCIRQLPYERYLRATHAVPSLFAPDADAVPFVPRPDGITLLESPEVMIAKGKFRSVPIIVGNCEDEGTMFSLYQSNVTTVDDMVRYISKSMFPEAPVDSLKEYVPLYEPMGVKGCPFRTSASDSLFPGFKRIAAVVSDSLFFGARRAIMKMITGLRPEALIWGYQASFNHNVSHLGTYHSADTELLYKTNTSSRFINSTLAYYANFVNNLDPNRGVDLLHWPLWKEHEELMLFRSQTLENKHLRDDFRSEPIGWVEEHLSLLRL